MQGSFFAQFKAFQSDSSQHWADLQSVNIHACKSIVCTYIRHIICVYSMNACMYICAYYMSYVHMYTYIYVYIYILYE
jgi:hypothetical protein